MSMIVTPTSIHLTNLQDSNDHQNVKINISTTYLIERGVPAVVMLVPTLLPVLLARPLDHARPVLLAVPAPALIHAALRLPTPLGGGARGGGRYLGGGRELGLAHGHGLAQPDVLPKLLVDRHTQLESLVGNSHRQALTWNGTIHYIIFRIDFYSFYWVINDQFD